MPNDAQRPPHRPAREALADEIQRAPFPYMRWAKQYLPTDPRSLGLSGLRAPPQGAPEGLLPDDVPGLGPAIKTLVGARYGVVASRVHIALGSSGANFLAYHTFARNGRVAAERPAYQALHALAPAVGATLSTFERDPSRGWRIDPASFAAALSEGVDLIAVTDLHNPSGQLLHPDDLALLGDAAERHDALVLVDEVYLDFVPGRLSAVHAGTRFVATNSLTKAHGLGPLRVGWLLADPERIRALEEADDLVNPALPAPCLAAAARYLPDADRRLAPVLAEAERRRIQVDAWVSKTPGVSWVAPAGGLTGFLDLPGVDGEVFCARLLAEFGIQAVPGSFFQRPEGARISYLLQEQELARGLDAITSVLAGLSP